MPITKSAKKALRQNLRRRKRNLAWKRKIKNLRKELLLYFSQKDIEKFKEKLSSFYKVVDKSAKTNVIKENTAKRLKSRMAKRLDQLLKAKKESAS